MDAKKKINISERKLIQFLFLCCSVTVVILSLIGDKGFLQLHELKKRESRLQEEITELKEEKRLWLRKIESIRGNRRYLETYAREQLGMVRNNEMLFRLVTKENER